MRELPKSVDSKYKFVTLAARRCEMLQKGAPPKIDASDMSKFTSVAMEEVLDDLIKFEMSKEESDTPVEPDESESSSPGPGLL